MTTSRLVTVAWFVASVSASILGQVALYVSLVRRGARPKLAMAVIPGLLDAVYAEWCEANCRSPRRILILRRACDVNLLFSLVPAVLGFP